MVSDELIRRLAIVPLTILVKRKPLTNTGVIIGRVKHILQYEKSIIHVLKGLVRVALWRRVDYVQYYTYWWVNGGHKVVDARLYYQCLLNQ